ncbi:MAG: hypothetical protein ACUVUB_04835 [Candidatus Bathyarchaeia archaeon]
MDGTIRLVMMLLALTLTLSSTLACTVEAEPPPVGASTERIAGYNWYHWPRAGSDSCILWLGGGKVTPTYVTVNPYILESLNTIRFIQDLSNRYGVVALADGEVEYRVDSRLISKVCSWIRGRGYTYAFAVGYSTGGMALAYELTVPDVGDSGPDGAVIISSMVDWRDMAERYKTSSGIELYTSARNSRNVRRSTLLIYGEAAWFWRQGEEYYRNLPGQGWINGYWFVKEWRLMKGVEHEVFTLEEDGSYDSKPFVIIVDFLERIRASSFKNLESLMSNKGKIGNIKINYPPIVRPYSLFKLNLTIPHIEGVRGGMAAVYDLDVESFIAVAGVNLSRRSPHTITLACVDNRKVRDIQAVLILNMSGEVEIKDSSPVVRISVGEGLLLRIKTGIPKINVTLDGKTHVTDSDGRFEAYISRGRHIVEVPAIIQISSRERLLFTSWRDNVVKSLREVYLDEDCVLEAGYVPQYLLEVSSEYGFVDGTGWYDVNSTATVEIRLNINSASSVGGAGSSPIFYGWSDYPECRSLLRKVYVDGPKSIKANWTLTQEGPDMAQLFLEAAASISIFTLIIYILIRRRPSVSLILIRLRFFPVKEGRFN